MDTVAIEQSLSWIDQVAGGVWVGLTALLGLSAYRLARTQGTFRNRYTNRLLVLVALIWTYPLYTFGFQSLLAGLIGNIVVAAFAGYVVTYSWKESHQAALLVTPIIGWLSVATFYISLMIVNRA